MSQTIVVVTFYSRGGSTETLATAAAVGAVQMRAGIRMRRMPDIDPVATIERFPSHAAELRRMHKEYVATREADVIAANVLIFASPPDVSASSPEWAPYIEVLERLHSEGKLLGKVAAAIDNGPSFASFSSLIQRLGFMAVPPVASDGGDDVARCVALGRIAVSTAQSHKTSI